MSKLGLIQAKELAVEMRLFRPIKIFNSPLSRAKQTVQIIGKECSIGIEVCEGINNIELESWEGKTKHFIAQKYPKQ